MLIQLPANWIVYNKPGYELTNEHAGFILGLGLNGHLAHLSSQTIHDYLSQVSICTRMCVLINISAHDLHKTIYMHTYMSVHVICCFKLYNTFKFTCLCAYTLIYIYIFICVC